MIRLLLADDEAILQDSLRLILEQDRDIEVTDCVENGFKALESCRLRKPDIVLMDIVMPVCDGVEGTRLIKSEFPDVKVIILTTFNDDENVTKALMNGADGYLLKLLKTNELISSIKNSVYNISTIHSHTLKTIINQIDTKNHAIGLADFKILNPLTDREIDIINLVVDGKSNREIAATLYISEGSIKNSITTMLQKLKLKDRTQLAVFAIRNNIV